MNAQVKKAIVIELADTMIRTAAQAIDRMQSEYFRKDGLHQLEAKVEQVKEKLATHIYGLAVSACKLGKDDPDISLKYFLALCKAAETHFKEKNEVENVKEILPIWPVYKSEIKASIERHLLPTKFETYGQMRTAWKEVINREKESAQRGARPEGNANRKKGEAGTGAGSNVAGAMGAGKVTVTQKLASVLKVMQGTIDGMDADTQELFAERLATLIGEFAPKVAETDRTAPKEDDKAAEAA